MEQSDTAKDALKKKKFSRAFFRRFDVKPPELPKNRKGMVSMKRRLNCSQEIAEKSHRGISDQTDSFEYFH